MSFKPSNIKIILKFLFDEDIAGLHSAKGYYLKLTPASSYIFSRSTLFAKRRSSTLQQYEPLACSSEIFGKIFTIILGLGGSPGVGCPKAERLLVCGWEILYLSSFFFFFFFFFFFYKWLCFQN